MSRCLCVYMSSVLIQLLLCFWLCALNILTFNNLIKKHFFFSLDHLQFTPGRRRRACSPHLIEVPAVPGFSVGNTTPIAGWRVCSISAASLWARKPEPVGSVNFRGLRRFRVCKRRGGESGAAANRDILRLEQRTAQMKTPRCPFRQITGTFLLV